MLVAIVGRPNVGKSTLFNRIAGRRIAIVEDTPGVTRDRIYSQATWLDKNFTIIDTGGIEPDSKDPLLVQMKRQAGIAIDSADVIIFLVDAQTGLTQPDSDIANILLKNKKPIILVCNKVDTPAKPPMSLYEFYSLGLGQPIPVSSANALGIGDLLDEVCARFQPDQQQQDDDVIKVAVIGKPNAGKSSLVNTLLKEERLIVSDIPGTTRDAVDTYFERDGQRYVFIDTAGMRKKNKIYSDIERYSVIRSLAAVDRSDVCVIMLDASDGVTEQDTKIAGYAHDKGKASIIAVNKWDIISKQTNTMRDYQDTVREGLSYMTYAPVEFISAKTGQRVENLFGIINHVYNQSCMRISTGALNDIINESMARVQPPADKGKRLKIFYITQPSVKPPTFVIFVNDKELMHFSYERYLENQIRRVFGLEGTPIRLLIREKK